MTITEAQRVDLEIELQKSIEKKTKRDAERHKNNSKLK